MPNISFVNPIPSSYNVKRQRVQFVETTGPTKLPEGKVWVHAKGEYTIQEMKSHGITHFSKYDLTNIPNADRIALENAGETYDAVPRPEAFLQLPFNGSIPETWGTDQYGIGYSKRYWPNGPFNTQQAIDRANGINIQHNIFVGETEEGESWIAPNHPMWKTIWDTFRQRMHNYWTPKGKPYYISANYFYHFGNGMYGWTNLKNTSRSEIKAKFARPVSQYEPNDYTPGGNRSSTNLVCEGIYVYAPDLALRIVSQNIFNHLINKKMGYYSASFLAGVHEWRPNNYVSIEYAQEYFPEAWGMFFRADKIPLDPSTHISIAAWTLEFGDMFIEWAGSGKPSNDNVGYGWVASDLWYPNGSTTPTEQIPQPPNVGAGGVIASGFPYYQYQGGKGVSNDWSAFGVRMYSETFGKVTGPGSISGFCEYRLKKDGVWGSWITPSDTDANEIIDSFHDNRAFVRYRRLGGQIAFGYLNEMAPNIKQSLEIKHPVTGIIYSGEVCGSSTYMTLIIE